MNAQLNETVTIDKDDMLPVLTNKLKGYERQRENAFETYKKSNTASNRSYYDYCIGLCTAIQVLIMEIKN